MLKDRTKTKLSSRMEISENETPLVYAGADERICYTGTGTTGDLPFRVKQTVTNDEIPGEYIITIVFTGSIISP